MADDPRLRSLALRVLNKFEPGRWRPTWEQWERFGDVAAMGPLTYNPEKDAELMRQGAFVWYDDDPSTDAVEVAPEAYNENVVGFVDWVKDAHDRAWEMEKARVHKRKQESMRDDIDTLPIPQSAKRYARRKGLKSMMRQPHDFQVANAKITNPTRSSRKFTNRDDVGKVPHAMKEAIVDAVLEGEPARNILNKAARDISIPVKWNIGVGKVSNWEMVTIPFWAVRKFRELPMGDRSTFLIKHLRATHGKSVDQFGDLDVLQPGGKDPMKVTTRLKQV